MPWKQTTTVQQTRAEFVADSRLGSLSFTDLCRQYGISRKTGYKWLKRHKDGFPMTDRSRRHLTHKARTSDDVIERIVELRREHPTLGGQKISIMLRRQGIVGIPSGNTVTNILRARSLLNAKAIERARHLVRFAKLQPNEMWQSDFKGYLVLATGEKCKPLNIIDDCSRFCLRTTPLLNEDLESVRSVFCSAMREYGKPLALLCDNGNPWGVQQSQGLTEFESWLMEHDILPIHGKPYHPQTQGKEESFNKTLVREGIPQYNEMDMLDITSESETFRQFYNSERPHFGIGGKVPADLYSKSDREYDETADPWDYGNDMTVSRVNSCGCVSALGRRFFLTRALTGRDVGIRESAQPGKVNVFFRNFIVARYSLATQKFDFIRAYRKEGDPRPTFPGIG